MRNSMHPRWRPIGSAVLGLVLAAVPAARGQVLSDEFTSGELACQNGAATTLAKMLVARTKCLTKCLQGVRKGTTPASDCQPPAFGGATALCVADAAKGAEAKARAGIAKVCGKDCPECYSGGDCAATAASAVTAVAGAADAQLAPFVYCGTQSGLTAGEAKCEDTAAKNVTKLAGSLAKCTTKCKSSEAAGKVPVGSCNPPAADLATAACVQKAQDKTVAAIDKGCTAERPACYSSFPGLLFSGVVTAMTNARYPATYCGFPSPAFID